MKIVTKTSRNLRGKTCTICLKTPKENERVLYKQSSGGYYNRSSSFVAHLTCLAATLAGEPEFQDPEVANAQFEEYKSLLLEKYKPVVKVKRAPKK